MPDAGALAMDAIQSLATNVPDWIQRLDVLDDQINQRQLELARLVDAGSSPPSKSSPSSPSASPSAVDAARADGAAAAAAAVGTAGAVGGFAPSRAKSVRNKGSTESLRPNDEGAAWKDEENQVAHDGSDGNEDHQGHRGHKDHEGQEDGPTPAPDAPPNHPAKSPQIPRTPPTSKQRGQGAGAQARARATLRKRTKRSDSLMTAEGATPKYRTRSMIIVYYDSYVQSFFEDLVKFVSAQRNMMRKAKMAAKVAQIKRMAELEMPDAEEEEDGASTGGGGGGGGGGGVGLVAANAPIAVDAAVAIAADASSPPATYEMPVLTYRRTLQMRAPGMVTVTTAGVPVTTAGVPGSPGTSGSPGPFRYPRVSGRAAYMGRGAAGGLAAAGAGGARPPQAPDVYDELDKGLEYVQSMCEHAAHQFLRDGDCSEEVANIKRRLAETKEQADREMARAQKKEDAGAGKALLDEASKTRGFRPQSMRKSMAAGGSGGGAATVNKAAPAVDEGIDDMDVEIPAA